jgi:hypothetical protein
MCGIVSSLCVKPFLEVVLSVIRTKNLSAPANAVARMPNMNDASRTPSPWCLSTPSPLGPLHTHVIHEQAKDNIGNLGIALGLIYTYSYMYLEIILLYILKLISQVDCNFCKYKYCDLCTTVSLN